MSGYYTLEDMRNVGLSTAGINPQAPSPGGLLGAPAALQQRYGSDPEALWALQPRSCSTCVALTQCPRLTLRMSLRCEGTIEEYHKVQSYTILSYVTN